MFVTGVLNIKAFGVTMSGGDSHTFDTFECAVRAFAPACDYCGVETDGHFYCCASMAGVDNVSDRPLEGPL